MASSIIENNNNVIAGSIGNLATVTFENAIMVILFRYYNGANKKAVYTYDFSSTVGTLVNTFESSDVEVTRLSNLRWQVKNNLNAVISYIVVRSPLVS